MWTQRRSLIDHALDNLMDYIQINEWINITITANGKRLKVTNIDGQEFMDELSTDKLKTSA